MPRICVWWDSIAFGHDSLSDGGWVSKLQEFFDSDQNMYPDRTVYNVSISWDTTTDVCKRLTVECKARIPDIVLFAVGINDSQYIWSKAFPKVSRKYYEENILALVAIAEKYTSKICFVWLTDVDEAKTMPIPWSANTFYDEENIRRYDLLLESTCKNNDISYISMEWVVSLEELPDGLHPDSEWHMSMFKRIQPYILSIIES
jgi:lysophospholipase L1-like esterase